MRKDTNYDAYLRGMVAGEQAFATVREELRARAQGPCTCDQEDPFVTELRANKDLRQLMIAQGEAESEEALYEGYRQHRAVYGCGSRVCRVNPFRGKL